MITQRSEQPMPESLRLYLDQMFPLHVAHALRGEGHDVMSASEVGQARSEDHQILQKAIEEKRILVTLDEHFGDWVNLSKVKTWPPRLKKTFRTRSITIDIVIY